MRRPGVLPTLYRAPPASVLVGARVAAAAYSWIEDTPIYLGENDQHGDCLCVAAFNAAAIADRRRGIVRAIDNAAPFALYEELGGMPADVGLDPATLITRWQAAAIGGYRLDRITSIALDDANGMGLAIEDTGFCFLTAMLNEAQLTQKDWAVVSGSPQDGGHAFLLTGMIGSRFTDDTWGSECWAEKMFIAAQGRNAWRCELVAVAT